MLPELGESVKRIAIVRALHVGDLLLAVPAWRALHQAFPEAEITLIGLPWAKDFTRRYRYVDHLLEFPGYPGMLEVETDERRLAEFLAAVRARPYDLAVQMHGSGEASAMFTAELGARFSVGYEPMGDGQRRYLSYGLQYPDHLPEIYRNLRLAEFITARAGDPRLEFPLLPEDHATLAALPELSALPPGATLVGIHPGARPPARRWMPERFAAVGDDLARRYGATVAITGGPGEEEIAGRVADMMATRALNVAGRTSLGALAALIARMQLFISNDSGPAHVAVAVGTPSIAIFGPADPARWAPLDQQRHRVIYKKVECSPCPHWTCPIDHRCLRRIGVEEVLAVAGDLLLEAKAA